MDNNELSEIIKILCASNFQKLSKFYVQAIFKIYQNSMPLTVSVAGRRRSHGRFCRQTMPIGGTTGGRCFSRAGAASLRHALVSAAY